MKKHVLVEATYEHIWINEMIETTWSRAQVGRLQLGAKFTLWNPETHATFPAAFRRMVPAMLARASIP